MSIPKNITKEHIEKAVAEIDPSKIPAERLSYQYLLKSGDKSLPPKYVIGIANKFANKQELPYTDFTAIEAKRFLENLGFEIFIMDRGHPIEKTSDILLEVPKIWIEKSIVNKRPDRLEGDRALGKVLWSPQKDKRGADIYKNMRLVEVGDIILHFIDNRNFVGISKVKNIAIETKGLKGTNWEGPSYLIELTNYTVLTTTIDREEILNNKNKSLLLKLAEKNQVFYNREMKLREGAYLTICPPELGDLINNIYKKLTNSDLPFVKGLKFEKPERRESTPFSISTLIKNLPDSGLQLREKLVTRFVSSLLTKPFVILTGLSGSGKTKLAQAFAMWICENDKQYCLVPVGADWTNREPLLGFSNALDKENYVFPENGVLNLLLEASREENISKPFFLILDEMNLSHVERYFADFLSIMESKDEKGILLHSDLKRTNSNGVVVPQNIKLPENLFIIGTVNIDETTYMFSPKVLDRANVIEFRVNEIEMRTYLKSQSVLVLDKLNSRGANMSENFVDIAKNNFSHSSINDELQRVLLDFFNELKKTGAEFGYRSASEILRFAAVVNKINPEWTFPEIMDAAIMQKLLPKVHGSRKKLEPVLRRLGELCLLDPKSFEEILKSENENDFDEKGKYPISLEKICRMYKNLMHNGFTSYAEA